MVQQVYQVASSALNLRELPDPKADILTTLPRAHVVIRLDTREWGKGWWRVEADQNLMTYQGYVAAHYLTPYNPKGSGKPKTSITAKDLMDVAKNAKQDLCNVLAPAFQAELPRHQINTGLRIAHFVAQMAHETANFRTLVEYASGEAYEGRKSLGNTQPGDGPRYKGRGVIQLTGRANYRLYGQKIGVDLENNPEKAADPAIATKVACVYWTERKINEAADSDDVYTVTKRINGGFNGIEDRMMKLKLAKAIWTGKTIA